MSGNKSLHEESTFWDALATHHAAIEDNYLDRASLHRILGDVRSPVLVVGAGQGLIVAELRSKGFQCDGADFSSEMIRHAKSRRGLEIILADASALPIAAGTYETIIYATGVIDFNGDEAAIRNMLAEGRRVLKPGGKIFVAFFRFSAALEYFLTKVGLLRDGVLSHRQSLETYLLGPVEMIRWIMKKAGTGWWGALVQMVRLAVFGTVREKVMTFKMQRIVGKMKDPCAFIATAPAAQPYRNEAEVRALFERLGVPIQRLRALATCWIVQV